MRSWPRILVIAALLASPAAFAQSPDPVAEAEARVRQLQQRAEALKAALAGDVCADKTGNAALLKATVPVAAHGAVPLAEGGAKPDDKAAKPDAAPAQSGPDAPALARKDLVDRLHKAVVLVIAEEDTGSGFFITPDIVVTNDHVVSGAANGRVMVVGRGLDSPKQARVVARTKTNGENQRDYAILKVEGVRVDTTLPLELQAGELSNVVAAGFPGLLLDTDMNFRALIGGDMKAMPELAMSQGAIMALQNRDRGLPVIAHSAPISGGNSGGPLVDMCGRVVGINTFINVAVDEASRAGFALAANDLAAYLRANNVQPVIATGGCGAK